ncbi:MAG TPA: hypothetical protein VFP64_09835, partial [Pyrinomonadaceae bacterium]|nr:hypothetical protein [Pyrinomonadaceae bacterium]
MHRQSIIFGSLILIVLIAITATGFVNGWGPLETVRMGILHLTSGGQMVSSRSMTEETKALSGARNLRWSL